MKIRDFIKLDKGGVMYRVVDATRSGYMFNQFVLVEGDRNVVLDRFAEHELVGFDINKGKTLTLFVGGVE